MRQPSCLFCREPMLKTEEEHYKQRMKRVEANDPVAISEEGFEQCEKGNYIRAFEYFTKAAALGDVEAHYKLAYLYFNGYGIEKDKRKGGHHLEEAAIGGHPLARHNLGAYEWNNGSKERAVRHWIIAASQGLGGSIKMLMEMFKREVVSKEDLASALRAHQTAVDATKSPQRDAAEAYFS